MTSWITRRHFNTLTGIGLMSFAGAIGARAQAVINFQANWLNDPEFLGYMIAIDNGYYAAEGLTVNYMPGGPNLIPDGSLLSGKSDIALTNMLTTAKAIVERNAPLKIIGTQYQKSPIGVISLASSGIKDPKDLIGKTVAAPPLSANIFSALLKLHNIPADQVRVVPFQFNPTPLINGSVDAVIDFATQLPFLIEQQSGKKASYFLMYDQGIQFYIDLVVVTEDTLKTSTGSIGEVPAREPQGLGRKFCRPQEISQTI